MKVILKSIIFFIVSSFTTVEAQQNRSYPYQGGEEKLFRDFESTFRKYEPGLDSAAIFFVEIKRTVNGKKAFLIFGGEKETTFHKIIRDFFKESLDKWDTNTLKKMNIIIPVFLSTHNGFEKTLGIEWPVFSRNMNMESKKSFFVSPFCFSSLGKTIID